MNISAAAVVFPGMFQVLAVCLLIAQAALTGQTPKPDALRVTIAGLDKVLFDSYNSCDLEKFASLFDDGVEFYHDNTGLMVGKQNVVDAVKQNICGKVQRALVPGTLEVYPLRNFGAVELGTHRFYHPGAAGRQLAGEAKFIQLWQNKDGVWKVTRVISYDHKPLTE